MDNISNLIEQIEQLSPENQAKIATYIEFLQWQETQALVHQSQGWSFSFIETFKEANVQASQEPAGMDVKMAPALVDGQSQPALWAHPPVVGQTIIEYYVPVPQQITKIQLRLAIGIRDGAHISKDNLVAFGIKVNGIRVWGEQSNSQQWQQIEISLDIAAGDMLHIEFTTECLGSHEWTWAVWGSPELVGKLG